MARPKLSDDEKAERKAEAQAKAKAAYQATRSLIEKHSDEYEKLFSQAMRENGFSLVSKKVWATG